MSDSAEPRNIRLLIAYDGTNYRGWQVQPNGRTVQQAVETAIHKLTGETVRVLSAGRTDSGVHALGQVASFLTRFPIDAAKFRPALQQHLPDDIIIRLSEEAPPDFHATFSAVSKRYRYVIYNSVVSDPFVARYSWRISQHLDVAAMQDAAEVLIGTHDFRSFESDWPNKATSVRTVSHLTITRHARWNVWDTSPVGSLPTEQEGPFICLEIEADGFLYNMVRAITGTLLYVGRGTWTKEDVRRVLQTQSRKHAGGTAPAQGLFMVRVNYADNAFPNADRVVTNGG